MSKIFKEKLRENERLAIYKLVANGEITPQKADDLLIELYNNKCKLLILSCIDPLMWYNDKIKKEFEFIKKIDKENIYLVKDDDGLIKMVKQWDAIIIPK